MESYPDYQRKVMGSYPDYSPEEYLDGWGWHQDQLVPVPGFGFFPSTMKEELEEEAQVVITVSFINSLLYSLNNGLLQDFLREVRPNNHLEDWCWAFRPIFLVDLTHQPERKTGGSIGST